MSKKQQGIAIIKTKKDIQDIRKKIEKYLNSYEPSEKTFPLLRGLYLELGYSRQTISNWKYSENELHREAFDTIKEGKDRIVIAIMEWMMYHPESKTTGMFYLKSIEKETFNEKIVGARDAAKERLSNEITESIEPVQIVIDLPKEKVMGEKVEYDGKKVK